MSPPPTYVVIDTNVVLGPASVDASGALRRERAGRRGCYT